MNVFTIVRAIAVGEEEKEKEVEASFEASILCGGAIWQYLCNINKLLLRNIDHRWWSKKHTSQVVQIYKKYIYTNLSPPSFNNTGESQLGGIVKHNVPFCIDFVSRQTIDEDDLPIPNS